MTNAYINGFKTYLQLEKGLSQNSINAYINDVSKLFNYFNSFFEAKNLSQITLTDLQNFVSTLAEMGLNERSQARIISGIKAFFNYLILEDEIEDNPAELLELPKIAFKLPEFLSIEEIDKIVSAIDLSKPDGERNKAIIETLYGSGLRVSELINLTLSNCFFDEGFFKIIGKGNKERLVPISEVSKKLILNYIQHIRNKIVIDKASEDIVFLNRRGAKLTREMIFLIVKNAAKQAGIAKNVSPHSFRHSFATHLIENGADLRVVQDMLGHASITTTEIYTHLNTQFIRAEILKHHPRHLG